MAFNNFTDFLSRFDEEQPESMRLCCQEKCRWSVAWAARASRCWAMPSSSRIRSRVARWAIDTKMTSDLGLRIAQNQTVRNVLISTTVLHLFRLKTEHLTRRSTRIIFFSLRAAHHICHNTCVGSKLDESSQHVCRVLKTMRWLHSHSSILCLVATSLACLSVSLLFLMDKKPNRESTVTILAAEPGLAELPNSPRSRRHDPGSWPRARRPR